MPTDFDFLAATGLCACGKPLHYHDPSTLDTLETMFPEPTVTIRGPDGARYLAQRHYIALHGLKAIELPLLARQHIIKRLPETT